MPRRFSERPARKGARTNTNSNQCFDVLLDGGVLAAGTYQIALSAFENLSFAENLGTGHLADGFTGLGNLAAGEDLHYAFDVIVTTQGAALPEPSTIWLGMAAILAMSCLTKKRNEVARPVAEIKHKRDTT